MLVPPGERGAELLERDEIAQCPPIARHEPAYVETLRDEAVTLAAQRAMHQAACFDEVVSVDSDHSPRLSRPRELADVLGRLVPAAVRTAGA
ncbi:hypothetical protein ACWEOE_17200 [Amycolatopsis sp. NPDC004368]